MADGAVLTLAVVPSQGFIKLVKIKADDLRQEFDKVTFVLKAIQKECGNKLQPNAEVEQQLEEILRWFKPGYSPFGNAVLQIPGQITLQDVGGSSPPSAPAAPAQPTQAEQAVSQERVSTLEGALRQASDSLKKETARLHAIERAHQAAQTQCESLQRQVNRAAEDAKRWQAQYDTLNKRAMALEAALSEARTRLQLEQRQAQASQPALIAAQHQLALVTAQNSELRQENAIQSKNIEQLNLDLEDLRQQVSDLQTRARAADDDLLTTASPPSLGDEYLP